MQDPFVVDASHPITTLSCLAPQETLYAHEAAQIISWLHDGHPANSNGSEYFIFFITLWHACSLLQPDLFDLFSFDSEFRRVAGLRAPVFTIATHTLLERLAAAWLSHPMHVPVLTSPGGDQLEIWLCDSILFHSDAALTSRPTVVRSYGGGRGTGGGGGDSSEHILACHEFLDTCYYGPSSDVRLPCRRVGYDVDNGPTIVTVRMPAALDCAPMTDSASLEGSWQAHALGPGMASPDSPSSESQGQARARDGRSSTSTVSEESHEARGVALIIKALVQQNAGASVFLRTMIICVAALLCFAHSILGERPS